MCLIYVYKSLVLTQLGVYFIFSGLQMVIQFSFLNKYNFTFIR